MASKKSSNNADQAKRDKIKLIVIVSVCVLCSVWIVYYWSTAFGRQGPIKPDNSPSAQLIRLINKTFAERQEFGDVGVEVVSENPLKIKLSGLIKKSEDPKTLEEVVKTAAPGAEIENTVERANY